MAGLLRPAFWIGAGVVLAIEFLPGVSKALRPAAVRAARAGMEAAGKVREAAGRAKEGLEDILAEAKAQEAEPETAPATRKPRTRRATRKGAK
jgi:hypothetical protein